MTNALLKKYPGIYVVIVVVFLFALSGVVAYCAPASHGDFVLLKGGIELPKMPARKLARLFDRLNYNLADIRAEKAGVPRLIARHVPKDMNSIKVVKTKKRLFIRMMLPLVLIVNEELAVERQKLLSLKDTIMNGEELSPEDDAWFAGLADDYGASTKTEDPVEAAKIIYNILANDRVDVLPVSLALAQSIEESGWGTSRFARKGNALFGEWTWDGNGMVPAGREAGKKHRVRTFEHLLDAVRSYANNLNSNKAYHAFRNLRKETRRRGKPYYGLSFANTMVGYSQRGIDYVNSIKSIMRYNKLTKYDMAKLADDTPDATVLSAAQSEKVTIKNESTAAINAPAESPIKAPAKTVVIATEETVVEATAQTVKATEQAATTTAQDALTEAEQAVDAIIDDASEPVTMDHALEDMQHVTE